MDLFEKQKEIKKSLSEWNNEKEKIIDKYKLNKNNIFSFFSYFNLSFAERSFCPLFKSSQLCHDICPQKLNCIGCYCEYYDVNYLDNGFLGRCKINSKDGKYSNNIWDCSGCLT